jgi:ActR/RegA family two-component response regulator
METDNKISVLVIDEDNGDQEFYEDFFQRQGGDFVYSAAYSLGEARGKLKEQRFDAVISDISFMDGHCFEILPAIGDASLIIVTSRGDEVTAVKAINNGAADYIVKDVERGYLEMLPAAVKKAIVHKRYEYIEHILIGALKAVNECVGIVGPRERIIFANDSFCKKFGLKSDYYLKTLDSVLKDFDILGEHGEQDFRSMFQKRRKAESWCILSQSSTKRVGVMRLIPVVTNPHKVLGYVLLEQTNAG